MIKIKKLYYELGGFYTHIINDFYQKELNSYHCSHEYKLKHNLENYKMCIENDIHVHNE
jgi:hypothetical protein